MVNELLGFFFFSTAIVLFGTPWLMKHLALKKNTSVYNSDTLTLSNVIGQLWQLDNLRRHVKGVIQHADLEHQNCALRTKRELLAGFQAPTFKVCKTAPAFWAGCIEL